MFALRWAGASIHSGAATGRLHRQSLGAQGHGVIDAIVSIKTFRNATLRQFFFQQSCFDRDYATVEKFKEFKSLSSEHNSQNGLYAEPKRNLSKISFTFVSTYRRPCYLRRTLRRPAARFTFVGCSSGRPAAEPAGAWSNR